MPQNYLVEHTVGSIVSGAFRIYGRNFGTLFLIYLLPVVPVAVIQGEVEPTENFALLIPVLLLSLVVSLLAYSAITVAVSDICLGNAPSLKRSYARVFGKLPLLLLATNLLQIIAIVVGLVLLVIPGLILMFWLLSVPSVVVLEGKSGFAALKRSKQLGDGFHWRNVGVFLLLMLVLFVIVFIISFVLGMLVAFFPEVMNESIFRALLTALQQGLVLPVVLVALILIYYDERVRKEGYDARALAQDLAR